MKDDVTSFLKCTTLIESICDNDENNNRFGTGFFISNTNSQIYLITNAHVINQYNKINIYVTVYNKSSLVESQSKLLIDASNTIYHNTYDICSLNITNQIAESSIYKLLFNSIDISSIPTNFTEFRSITDVYSIGYPNTIRDTKNGFPIVKKGITSTLISVDYDCKLEFLIDILSIDGSSGSPIFATLGDETYLVGISYASFDYCKKDKKTMLPTGISKVIKSSVILEMVC